MTDARFPERWLNDRRFNRLTDAAYRAYAMALLWSVANRTDGHLDESDLRFIPWYSNESARALESEGLWERRSAGWIIVDFTLTQTSSDELQVLENNRRRDRERKRRQRSKTAVSSPKSSEDAHSSPAPTSGEGQFESYCPPGHPGGHPCDSPASSQLHGPSRRNVPGDISKDTARPGQDKARTGQNYPSSGSIHPEDALFLQSGPHAA